MVTGQGSKVTRVKVKGHEGQGQPIGHDIGRWAHINVKLHFYSWQRNRIVF